MQTVTPSNIHIETKEAGAITVVSVEGDLRFATVAAFEKTIADLLGQGRVDLLIDLQRMTKFDNAGVGALVGAYTRTTNVGGHMRLLHIGATLREMLEATQLISVFPIDDDEDLAMSSFPRVSEVERDQRRQRAVDRAAQQTRWEDNARSQRPELRMDGGAATAFPTLYVPNMLDGPFLLGAIVIFIGCVILMPTLTNMLPARAHGDLRPLLWLLPFLSAFLFLCVPGVFNVVRRYRWSRQFPQRLSYRRLRRALAADPRRFVMHVQSYGGGFDRPRRCPAAVLEDSTTNSLAAVYPPSWRAAELCEVSKVKVISYA